MNLTLSKIDKPITIAVILFVVLVLALYLVTPKYKEFQGLLTKIGLKEAEFQGKDAYFIEVTKAHKELMQHQDSLKKIESALPDRLLLAPLINLIFAKGTENGILVQKIAVASSVPTGAETKVQETTISINLLGSYTALKKYLNSLEKSARLIEGESFGFSITPPSLSNPVIQETFPVQLSIKVHSY